MKKLVVSLLVGAVSLFGQYKTEPAGAPPSDLPAAMAQLLNKDGIKVESSDGKVFCEVWLVSKAPSGPSSREPNVTLPTIPAGAFLGVLRFPGQGADRRGQTIKAGVYTLRYSDFPINGDHQGVAPQRDFLIISPIAVDSDPKPVSDFDALMALSRKATGTQHPGILSLWKQDTDATPGFAVQDETDWVWRTKLGDLPVAIILVGQVQG